MKVGIIGAMPEEVSILRQQIKNCSLFKRADREIYTGILHGAEVSLLKSGIGKVAAAVGTTLLIEHFKPDYVINIGSAGGLHPTLHIGDVVISTAVGYHDVDMTHFGYLPGQLAECPPLFTADPSLILMAQQAVKQISLSNLAGTIVSGDTFINGGKTLEHLRRLFPDAIAVDMEAAAIAHVCHSYHIPFVVVRAISDVADKVSHISFKDFLPTAVQTSSATVVSMLTQLLKKS